MGSGLAELAGTLGPPVVTLAKESNVKPGRNDPCPCGSGKKWKSCCGQLASGSQPQMPDNQASLEDVPRAELERLIRLMDAGRYAELEEGAQELLGVRPQAGFVWQLLGIALSQQGKDALKVLATAAQLLPNDAVAHFNLGNALGRCGRLAEAAASYGRALAVQPLFAEALNSLGALQVELGRPDEAAVHCRRALQVRPDFADAHQTLGKALFQLGQPSEAVHSCRRAVQLKPDAEETHNSLGILLLKLARFEDAIASFRRALQISPEFVEAHANLANALRSIGRLDEAVASYERALRIEPHFVSAHTELATALRLQGRAAESEASCARALELNPDSAATLAVLAELRADHGRFTEAEALFQRAVSIDPESQDAWAGLARVRRMTPADGAWLEAAQHLADRGLPPQREVPLRYAIGKFFDDIEDFDRAFAHYRRANELARQCGPGHDRAQLTRTMDLIIRSHDRQWLARNSSAVVPSTRPVFIVGMLRAGTSLAEQILASHPAIFGAGELTFWSAELAAAICAATAVNAQQIQVSEARLAGLGNDYLERLQRLSADAARVVDKFPTNFLCLGLIHAVLPQARIIHLRRNPVDTCLSIYFQHFEVANTYANDLADLAHYYGEYRRLMQHWRAVLPASVLLEVPYEGLVQDPEGWTRKMLQFIDLPWNARCLDFHRTARTVVTASKWQVRQKIHTASVERWRHYQKFLGPLLPLLQSNSP